MKLLSGGHISDTISYYTYFLFTEEGKIAGLEDTYLAFSNVFGLPVSVVFGQYRISDPIKPTETRLTFEEYKIFKFRVGQSQMSLSYDRGIMGSSSTNFGTDFIVQVVNGNGIDTPDIFDRDKYKSLVWRVAQSFREKTIRLGILGYHGKEEGGGTTNTVSYLGPDLRLRMPRVEILLQFVRRTDSNPFFSAQAEKHNTDAYFGELIFSPQGDKGRWYFTFVYNRIKSCFGETNCQRITMNANYLLRRNMRWIYEYTHDMDGKDHRFLTGIMVGI
jgi:hypothetical protein